MANEKKAGDILATADFRLTGKAWNDRPVDEKVHAELAVSGAFQYGNQTCMAFIWENGNIDSFDTRYERVSPKNFKQFALEVLKGMTADTINVEAITE